MSGKISTAADRRQSPHKAAEVIGGDPSSTGQLC